jgi:dTDP-4-dehydrorhamnose 3,5-epimerase
MTFTRAAIPDIIIIEPDSQGHEPGFVGEAFNPPLHMAGDLPATFMQDDHLCVAGGTVRGLHAPRRRPIGKLVRVTEGEIFAVAVDIRRGSPSFGKWVGFRLSAENARQCYIPPGFAHGFCVASEAAQVDYQYSNFYDPADEIHLLWNDPEIDIAWPVDCPQLSDRDRSALLLREVIRWFPVYECALEVA